MHRSLPVLVALVVLVFAPSAQAATATALLASLPTAAETTTPAYDRDAFQHWTSANGCTARQTVLLRQNLVRPRPGCRAATGRWFSAYDGRTLTVARQLDIDHLIPLADAWRSGASGWDDDTRKRFANDLAYGRSLLAVSAGSNRSKGDRDPARWMPPRVAYRCTYAVSWIAVKVRWQLTVDAAERTALQNALRGCARAVVTLPMPPRAAVTNAPTSPTPPPAQPTPTPPAGDTLDPRFPTCRAAIDAGYGPYRRGVDPEYAWYRDADSDGIVCER